MLQSSRRHAPLLVLLLVCLGLGAWTTAGLTWPHDVDLYRNMAQAQTIADGAPFADPYYRGEKAWYNPLTPALVAGLSRLTGLDVPRLYAQSGAYLNLLVPLSFYALAHALFGRGAAVAATFYVVFLGHPEEPGWMRPMYSPWLFAGTFGQCFFYLGLVAYGRARERQARAWFAAAGVLLGLAFLSHTAPALVLGGVVAIEAVRLPLRVEIRGPEDGAGHAWLGALALLVALPFLATIAGVYHLKLVNPAGNDWFWSLFDPERLLPYLVGHVSPSAAIAGVGLALILFRGERGLARRLFLTWLAVAATLTLYGLVSQWAARRGVRLPNAVPLFHFWLYVKAAGALGFGYALAEAVRLGARRLGEARRAWLARNATVLLTLGAVLAVFLGTPPLLARKEFDRSRRQALKESAQKWRDLLRDHLRRHSRPDEVVLADGRDALMVVGPTGRRTVTVLRNFANPYVAWEPRASDARSMLKALSRADAQAFAELAAVHDVGFVLHRRAREEGLDLRELPFLKEELRVEYFTLYRVDRSVAAGKTTSVPGP